MSPSPQSRYPSDLTDAQWEVIQPLLPPPARLGRREKHPRREIVNAIFYVLGDALFEHGGDIWGEDVGVAGSCWKAPAIGGGLG